MHSIRVVYIRSMKSTHCHAMEIPESVLIVDDEIHIRAYLRKILQFLDIDTVYEASNGTEALIVYQREIPDIVLLDLEMPGKNGYDTLVDFMKQYPSSKVMMLSSVTNRQVVKQCLATGAKHYLLKEKSATKCAVMLEEAFDRVLKQAV